MYHTKFNKARTQTYPFIKEVPGDAYSFLCTICKRQVSCKHQGRHDVERHIGKVLHQSNVKAAKSQTSLPFPSLSSALSEKVRYPTVYYNTANWHLALSLQLFAGVDDNNYIHFVYFRLYVQKSRWLQCLSSITFRWL